MRFLICEADWPSVALGKTIEKSGTLATRTDSPCDLEHYLQVARFDLVLVSERALKSEIGLAAIRRRSDAPIVVMAGKPGSAMIAGWLDKGADGVVDLSAKHKVTVAQLLSVARRAHGLARPEIELGGLTIDLAGRTASVKGAHLPLPPKVYELLEYMALRPNRLVTRDELLGHIYPIGKEPGPRIFDVFLHHLRRHLRAVGDDLRIETARGTGFRLVATEINPDAVIAA